MAYRRYRRRAPSTNYSAQPKYWETETPIGGPEGIRIADFVMKHFPQAGKVQTYNWLTSGGLSKGVTLHLDKMTAEELADLKSLLVNAIGGELDKRVATVGSASVNPALQPSPAPTPSPVSASPAASDPDHFKKLFAALRQKQAARVAAD
jgi:hypothetical protein